MRAAFAKQTLRKMAGACLVVVCITATLHAHSEPEDRPPRVFVVKPPAARNLPPAARNLPPRWSWVHWWEANRDRFLLAASQSARQPASDKVLNQLRAEAGAAIAPYLDDKDENIRAAAALTLGRIGHAGSRQALQKLSETDEDALVKQSALAAIGLLDGKESETYLTTRQMTDADVEGPATLAAMSLLKQPSKETLGQLVKMLDHRTRSTKTNRKPPEYEAFAALTLQGRLDKANVTALRRALANSDNDMVAGEAMLVLARVQDGPSLKTIATLATADHNTRSVAAWRALVAELKRENQFQSGQTTMLPPRDPTQPRKPQSRKVTFGLSEIRMARLRATAALALGYYDDRRATQVLVNVLREKPTQHNALPRGFAIMALAQQRKPEALPALIKVFEDNANPDSPIRGYAALALGLYARPIKTPQGTQNQPGYDKLLKRLAQTLADPRQTPEVRSACAVGLGLAGHTASLEHLVAAGKQLKSGDHVIGGYVLLARGLLGDRNLVEPVKNFLAATSRVRDSTGVLARRAAVLSLGLIESDEAVPALMATWEDDYHVNREALFALSLCDAQGVGRPVIDALVGKKDPGAEEFLIRLLGELLVTERPQRLSAFLAFSNYTVRNEARLPFNTMANEFLFKFLVPLFERQWL